MKILAFLLVLLFQFNLEAENQITFNRLTVENGLSHSSITCIYQDKKGFMWFGTMDGLNRYDGYSFKIFKSIASDSTSLAENFIFSILEDKSGTLFVETQSGKFHKYNPVTESFTILDKNSVDLQRSSISTVGAFYEDPSGIRWTGGLSKATGLTRMNIKTGETKVYKHNPSDPYSLSDDKVYSVFKDSKNRLWVSTFNGLDRLDEYTGKFYHYRNDPKNPKSLPHNWVWPIYEDTDGHLWIGTVQSGLCRFDPETNTFLNFKNDPTDQESISDNFIFSIYEDNSGVIWIGTNTGLNYFHKSAQAFEHYTHNPNVSNSVSDNNILSVLVDRNGYYWIGSRNGGLDRFDYKRKLFRNISHDAVQVIHEDKKGNLWLGTFSSGMAFYNPNDGVKKYYTHKPGDSTSLSDNRIYAIIEDKEGFLWVGTYGGGLNKFDRNTGKTIRYLNNPADPNSIAFNSVMTLAFDNQDNLWAGTFGGGVSVLSADRNKFKHYRNDPDDPSSISDNSIIRIFRDSKGGMWFGTTKGLSRFISKTGKFKSYREENGLANNFIYGIVEDNNGHLWLSTNNGLSKFDPVKETFKNYYVQDGLQENEFNQNAFAKDNSNGRLIFGGINGFNIFRPEDLSENKFIPPVLFTDYIRYNTDDKEGKPILEKGITERDSIVLTYKDNIINIQFAALSYYNNFENEYKYKLEGFNKNWIQLGSKNSVTFTNLSPGEYKLRVIGSNNDGIWNTQGALLNIEVLPPWWRTNIAYTAYVIMFFSALWGIRRFEMKQREQKALLRETELRMKATVAEKRAIEIENERKTKELEEARQLQLSMLPKELPQLPNLEISAFMRTATEVGGDYYDFICQDGRTLNIAFGDATGHGLQAGTMVTLMKGFFTSDAAKSGLQEFMNHCSSMIKEIKLGRILMSFSFIRIENNKLTITSGGMPPLYLFNCEKKETEEIIIQGMPLGAMRRFNYKVVEREIRPGDSMLLLTDGLPEQMNSNEEMYNYNRVKDAFHSAAVKSPEEIIQELVKSGDKWMSGVPQADDISMVCIKVK